MGSVAADAGEDPVSVEAAFKGGHVAAFPRLLTEDRMAGAGALHRQGEQILRPDAECRRCLTPAVGGHLGLGYAGFHGRFFLGGLTAGEAENRRKHADKGQFLPGVV